MKKQTDYFHPETLKNLSMASTAVWVITSATRHFLSFFIEAIKSGGSYILYNAIVSFVFSFVVVAVFSHKKKDFELQSIFTSFLNGLLLYVTVNGIQTVYATVENKEPKADLSQFVSFLDPAPWLPSRVVKTKITNLTESKKKQEGMIFSLSKKVDSLHQIAQRQTLIGISETATIPTQSKKIIDQKPILSSRKDKDLNFRWFYPHQKFYKGTLHETRFLADHDDFQIRMKGGNYDVYGNQLSLVPNNRSVSFSVISGGESVFDTTVAVSKIPRPDLLFLVDKKEVRPNQYIRLNAQELFLKVKPDSAFARTCPHDANFSVLQFDASLIRNGRVVVNKSFNQNFLTMKDLKYIPRQQDQLMITITQMVRKDYKGVDQVFEGWIKVPYSFKLR